MTKWRELQVNNHALFFSFALSSLSYDMPFWHFPPLSLTINLILFSSPCPPHYHVIAEFAALSHLYLISPHFDISNTINSCSIMSFLLTRIFRKFGDHEMVGWSLAEWGFRFIYGAFLWYVRTYSPTQTVFLFCSLCPHMLSLCFTFFISFVIYLADTVCLYFHFHPSFPPLSLSLSLLSLPLPDYLSALFSNAEI